MKYYHVGEFGSLPGSQDPQATAGRLYLIGIICESLIYVSRCCKRWDESCQCFYTTIRSSFMLNAGFWSCDYIIIDEDVADASPHSTVYHVLEEAVMFQKTANMYLVLS